jgi:hypothetical protein
MAAGMDITPLNKRTIRQQANPLDKATFVSVLPLLIDEYKHTIQPGHFKLEPGSPDKPQVLVVSPSSWWRDIGDEMPLIEIPNGAMLVAQSLVQDFIAGMIGVGDGAQPGLFYVPGEHDVKGIREKFGTELDNAVQRQKRWFRNLVDMADKDWAASNGNPSVISGLMKLAAQHLNFTDRPWMKTSIDIQKVPCAACGNLRNPAYPVCGTCNRTVDLELAKKMGLVEPDKVK